MFKLPHLLVILVTAALVPLTCTAARRAEPGTVIRCLKVCAVAALFFDPVYWVWEARTTGGIDFSTTLPLYLCSLFWLLLPAALFARRERVRQTACATVCTMGMLGGVFGLVFNVYVGQYSFFSFVPVRGLMYHVMMILVTAAMWASGYYRPQPADRYRCFLPVAGLVGVSLVLNRLFGWDYCYTAGGVGTPLERLSAAVPRSLFLLLLYGGLLALIQLIFYRRYLPRSRSAKRTWAGEL